MPKRRKTREQKIAADIRQDRLETVQSVIFSLPSSYKMHTPTAVISQNYIQQKDLQKTLLVSSSIIFLQLMLFYLLKHHVVMMPFASLQY